MTRLTMLESARRLAITYHRDQLYGILPYACHLMHVEQILRRYGITDETLLSAGWTHDLLEDTNCTAGEIENATNHEVAHITTLLTSWNGGRTRKDRHERTYPILAGNPRAITVKVADRLANVEIGSKNDMYIKEYPYFRQTLFNIKTALPETLNMWWKLDELLDVPNSGS